MVQRNDSSLLVFPSQLGWFALALQGQTVQRLVLGQPSATAALAALGVEGLPVDPQDQQQRQLVRRLQAFAAGQPDDFLDVTIGQDHLTPFARRVVYHCRRIPRGTTLTYGQLAARAGRPAAARAVGNVMARNRVPLIVPCHRVVAAGGRLGGYSAPEGLRMKKRLLQLEGALR